MTVPTALLLSQALHAHARGDGASAARLCLSILDTVPEQADALYLLSRMARDEGETGQALDLLRRACAGPAAALLHLLEYAALCGAAGQLAEARQAAGRATILHETAPIAWFCLGNMLLMGQELSESRRCFEQALALKPDLTQARHNLVIVLGRLGHVEAAVREFEILFAAAPQTGDAYGSLAQLLLELGFFREALALAEQAIELQPESASAYTQAAMIELQLDRHWPALANIGLALAFEPHDPKALLLKAHLLRLVEQFDEAVACCLDAFAMGIETPELLHAHALALHMAGESEPALAAYDRAADRAANPARALADKALLLDQIGRSDEAFRIVEAALALDPTLAPAWYNKSNAKRFTAGDPDIVAMAGLIAGGAGHLDRLYLHFALAKAHMDIGADEATFAHLDEANRLKRAILDYDPGAAEAQMAAIAALPADFGASNLVTHPDRLSDIPVFVVGMPRSGSSLVEQILASHPAIHGAGELLRFSDLLGEALNTEEALDDMATAYLAKLGHAAPEALRVIDKDLNNFLHLGTICRLFPRARIIHCRRDPLDTCFSAYTKLFMGGFDFAYDQKELGRYYRAYDRLMAHWRRVLPADNVIEVEYEVLVADMEAESRRLLRFIGLDWHPGCLRFFETPRVVRTASVNQVRQPIYRSSIGRARAFHRYLAPLIEALGDLVPAATLD